MPSAGVQRPGDTGAIAPWPLRPTTITTQTPPRQHQRHAGAHAHW